MYKLKVCSGLGDCLRIINNSKVVHKCLTEKVKCLLHYELKKDEGWIIANRSTFINLAKAVDFFEYLEEKDFYESEARPAHQKEYLGRIVPVGELMPIPLPHCGTIVDVKKINIAVQPAGSCTYKTFSTQQLHTIFNYFDSDVFTFYIIDKPTMYRENKERFKSFPAVVCEEFGFNENYNLITLCDLLIAPDSFSKYVAHAANRKMVIVCSKAPYITDIAGMFRYAFAGLEHNPDVKILGWKNNNELVDKISDFPETEIISAVQSLLAANNR